MHHTDPQGFQSHQSSSPQPDGQLSIFLLAQGCEAVLFPGCEKILRMLRLGMVPKDHLDQKEKGN